MSDPLVQAANVSKRFGSFTAVDRVSFSVDKGEFFGLLGPNGAGKTSIIRMLYGFSPLSAGQMSVFGLDIDSRWREIRSRIGVCQQENTLDPDLSVENNLLVFAGYYLMDKQKAWERAEYLLHFFALTPKRKEPVSKLSGGLARRLMLARSMINDPGLVILDEPTTGLDPQSRHQVWDKLMELRSQGLTMVLTTHYMEEAASLCHRLIIMDQGRILVEGSPQNLVREYAGDTVVEMQKPGPQVLDYVRQYDIPHDELSNRIIIYINDQDVTTKDLRKRFGSDQFVLRKGTLEDVFLRLTGRELRE